MSALRPRGPIFPDAPAAQWREATWIGQVRMPDPGGPGDPDDPSDPSDPDDPDDPEDRLPLARSAGYARARLLVRSANRLHGMVTLPVSDGSLSAAELAAAVHDLRSSGPPADGAKTPPAGALEPPITVVLCTRDRPEPLRIALRSVLDQDYPQLTVIVVDNAPATDATARVVAELADPRVRLVTEPTPGLSNARNTGVLAASTPWVAFTDDDVRADPDWLRGIARGIWRGGLDCAAVSGFVPTGELRTPAQAWFDSRIGWNRVFTPRVFRLSEPPADLPLFPFQVGVYGAGANFAARRDVIAGLRGFDVQLGAGTDTKGGEDIDFFFRLVLAGHTLVYEPSAVVWHRHRDTREALVAQAVGYGRGFSAWATKTVLTPGNLMRGLATVARRGRFSTAPLADYRSPMSPDAPPPEVGVDVLRIEHRATLSGPPMYLRARARALLARNRPGPPASRR